jgi:hypothetical protein
MGPSTVESTYTVAEDPVIWFSGGQYHVLYDYPGDRVGYHLSSSDGIHAWTDQGLAYDPRDAQQIFRYTDGTVDHWYKMERPGVVVENGHVTYVTFAVSDVNKDNQIPAGTDHGSKVIVVPFDGVTFDIDSGIGAGGAGGGGGRMGSGGASGAAGGGGGSGGGPTGGGGSGGSGGTGGRGGGAGAGGLTGSGGTGSTGGASGSGGRGAGGQSSGGNGGSGSGGSSTGNGGSGGAPENGGSTSGCSCAEAAGNRGSGSGWALLVGFGLVAAARRRRCR